MNKILGLILLILPLAVSGQRVHLTDSANSWRVYCDGGGTDYYSLLFDYQFKGDTTIAGNSYKRLVGTTRVLQHFSPYYKEAGSFYLREDSVSGAVWCRSKGWYDSSERLIYSPSWVVGDTIWRPQPSGNPPYKLYISGVDSTQINGQSHKVYKVRVQGSINTGSKDYFDIVEGMGSTLGPGFAFTGFPGGEFGIELRCFFNATGKPVLTPSLTNIFHVQSFSNSGPCSLAVSEIDQSRPAYLSPNPVTERSKIILPYSVAEARLVIYNAAGQVLASSVFTQASSVALPSIQGIPGLYFYRLTDLGSGQTFAGNFEIAQ